MGWVDKPDSVPYQSCIRRGPCLYGLCYHKLPATYPRTSAGPAFPERQRHLFANGCHRAKRAGSFGASSYLVLLRVMLTLPSASPRTRWALTPPFHPYPGQTKARSGAVCFLWCSCRIAPPGRYPAPCPVESGLSSHLQARDSGEQPPDPRLIPGTMIRHACLGNKRLLEESVCHPFICSCATGSWALTHSDAALSASS